MPNGLQTTCEQLTNQLHLRGWDCEPVLCHPRMVRIPYTANQNLSIFCTNTMRTECAGCPFHCSPQVRGKLINYAPRANGAAHKRRARVYKALDAAYLAFQTSLSFLEKQPDVTLQELMMVSKWSDLVTKKKKKNWGGQRKGFDPIPLSHLKKKILFCSLIYTASFRTVIFLLPIQYITSKWLFLF